MIRTATVVCCFAVLLAPAGVSVAGPVTIDTVQVGNPGNLGEPSGISGTIVGAVPYEYRIGRYEVTNEQYTAFLNEKAKMGGLIFGPDEFDPLVLYWPSMGSDARGGITRSGGGTLPDPYVYSAKPNMGDKPVNYVGWYAAIRFANWLHNGQGAGDTETGAYTLGPLNSDGSPITGNSITRNSGAIWFLPSEDEWYKAAYYDPTLSGGTGGYWDYPTRSNASPTVATANSVGEISNPGTNVANYEFGADWNSLNGNLTTVGSAGPLSESYYGTSDQGGNVWEWNEVLSSSGSLRGIRGGSWGDNSSILQASSRFALNPFVVAEGNGFRVATVVPEPSSWALVVTGAVGLWFFCRRRRLCGRIPRA